MPVRRSSKKNVIVVALGILLVGLVVVVVRNVWLTDSSTVVPVEEAVDRFRDETTQPSEESTPDTSTPATPPPERSTPETSSISLPAAGVYPYRTTGGESIDAMGGVTREYPAESALTVTPRGCGVHLSWDPLEERRDEWELCAPGPAVELQPGGAQFHEFFGQSQLDEISCDGVVAVTGSSVVPAATRTCTLADEPWTQVWEILGRSTLQVDGRDVAVTHARMTVEDDDEYWEHTTADWYLADSGLPVSVSVETSSRSPSMVGAVVYREAYELQLESMSPLT
jgi:hypothetical protein